MIDRKLSHSTLGENPELREQQISMLCREKPENSIECRYTLNDQIRWIHWTDRMITDATNGLLEYQCVGRDITERKQAEEALEQNSRRLRLLSETAGELLGTENPQKVVDELCTEVMAFLDCQAFFNFLVDENVGKLFLNACAGIPEEEIRKIKWLEPGVAVCGRVARDGKAIIAENIQANSDPLTELVASYGIQAYACHPLFASGKILAPFFCLSAKWRPAYSLMSIMPIAAVWDILAKR